MAIIYAVHQYYSNNKEFDLEIESDSVICAFPTKEKACTYIKNLPLPDSAYEDDEYDDKWKEGNPYPAHIDPDIVRHFYQKHQYDNDYNEIWYKIEELPYDIEA